MKHIVPKAVVVLLFLLIGIYSNAQRISIQPVDEETRIEIETFSITAYTKDGPKNFPAIVGRDTFESCDSFFVRAFGYQGYMLKGVKIPIFNPVPPSVAVMVVLTQLNLEINEVVISAAKFEEKKKDVPRQITVIKQNDIEFASQPTTADVLQNSGNVLVQKSQLGGGSPIIRGFEANKLQIVVDGVRMNNAIYRGGHLQNILRIDNNTLDRIEVIQGPGSVMYGSDALGGVMHFITKKPQLGNGDSTHFAAGAFARYSSAANETSGNFNFNLGLKKIAWLSSFTYTQLGDLNQGLNGLEGDREAWKSSYYNTRINGRDTMLINTRPQEQKSTGYAQLDVMQKVLWQQNKNISHLLNFQYSATNDVPRYDRLSLTDSASKAKIQANRFTNESPTNRLRNTEWYYGPEKRLLLAYTLSSQSSPIKRLDGSTKVRSHKITAAYQDITESRNTRAFKADTLFSGTENVKVFSVNADFQNLTSKNEWRYGAEAIYNKVTSTATAKNIVDENSKSSTTRYPAGGSNMFNGALYTTYSRELGKGLIFNAGARLNLVALQANFTSSAATGLPFTEVSQLNTSLNGQTGLVYNAVRGWRISGQLATGFRAPNVDDLAKVFDSNPADSIVIVPNNNLKPEYTYNAEITVGKLLGTKGMADVTGWYTIYNQAVVTQPFTYNGSNTIIYQGVPSQVYANQNAGSAYLYGASFTVRTKIIKSINFNGAINYTYGRVKTDSTPYPLDHIAPLYGRAGITWVSSKAVAEFFSLFNGAKKVKDYSLTGEDNFYSSTINGTPAWYTLNIRGSYKMNDHATLQLSVENILDQNYRVFSSGISAPGRNIIATVRVQM
jgi:hemoglobin/transferrin/lactoferrin receptor protein